MLDTVGESCVDEAFSLGFLRAGGAVDCDTEDGGDGGVGCGEDGFWGGGVAGEETDGGGEGGEGLGAGRGGVAG